MPEILTHSSSLFNETYVVRLQDGATVESVFYLGSTLCVSSQVGCAVRCPFCASGFGGLGRNLTVDELIAQVELVRSLGFIPTRVTVSGVGEPLHNASNVADFLGWCRKQSIAPSLTTSGGPIHRLREALVEWPHNGLTLSVHAGCETTRAHMVPKGPSLADLFATLGEVIPTLSRSRRKKTALAYLLVSNQNDSMDELEAFAERVWPLGLPIHLYGLNPVPTSDAQAVTRSVYELAYARLRSYHTRMQPNQDRALVVRMSSRARLEANGGCGTLVALRTKDGHIR